MRLLPSRSFSLETRIPPDEVVARLAAAVEPLRWFRWFHRATRPFHGEVKGDGFWVMRIPGYRNSFVPVISGQVTPTATGARIEGTMALHPIVSVGISVFLVYALIMGVVLVAVAIARWAWNPGMLVPFGLFLFGWALTAAGFAFEVWLSLGKLREVVGAETEVSTA